MLRVVALILSLTTVDALRVPAAALRRSCFMSMAEKDETSGMGFGSSSSPYAAEEARGREALEKLKKASAARGYDPSLQGLKDKVAQPEPTTEELQEFKSELTLGLAGFLILGGVVSLLVGGAIWDDTPRDNAAVEGGPAFGFMPQPMEQAPPPSDGVQAPSWASRSVE